MTREKSKQELRQEIEFLIQIIEIKEIQIESEQKRNKFLMSLIEGNPAEPEKPNWKIYK